MARNRAAAAAFLVVGVLLTACSGEPRDVSPDLELEHADTTTTPAAAVDRPDPGCARPGR